jgi:hypothetical protein
VIFYTYCYLDSNNKPYYIGKGCGDRIHAPHHGCFIDLPPREKRLFLKKNLTEEEAFKHEIYLIAVIGRKDLGLGPLLNLTNGGEGTSGWKMPQTVKDKIGEANSGRERPDMVGANNPMKKPEIAEIVAESKRGKPRNEETREKIRQTLTGRKDSKEVRSKKSRAAKGKKKSSSHAKNIKEAKRGTMYFVNSLGEVIVRKEHPGEGWQRGMKWKLTRS